ncbi:LacI family DNA-binding transcriptional regulator [Ruania zhangjianzhongii]|uniref:LacI family DNA-binding transcriptional regulator n=1 Tax=Ruania zhangjianzhongii TaxID=2603206 RepID=UPI00143D4208|nr:LacI family DNA-binding transcriptional regulator [Ruania zhangjianzhongii]
MNEHRTARITDVAEAAGVSTATVSRVLNGSTSVSPELAERVRQAALATRYIRNPNGRALRRQRSDMWAVIVSDLQNPFFTSLVAAVERVAVGAGYSVMLCNTDEQLERENAYLDAAIAQRMVGVVVSVTSEEESDLARLVRAQVPTVVVDRRVHDFTGDSVLLDNVRAGRLAAEHLLELGHRDVLCLAGPSGVSTTEDRLQGVRDAFADAGIAFDQSRMMRTDLRAADAEGIVAAALTSGPRPDAIFALNGPLTTGAYRAVQTSGLRIPDEISLVGFDDDRWTRMVTPAVTLIAQPVDEMGIRAAERIVARAADPEIEPVHVLLPPRLEVRGSTAPNN